MIAGTLAGSLPAFSETRSVQFYLSEGYQIVGLAEAAPFPEQPGMELIVVMQNGADAVFCQVGLMRSNSDFLSGPWNNERSCLPLVPGMSATAQQSESGN
jgi:hypothetical protein